MIELLEIRRLFDVTLSRTGTLTINGTHGDDVITVEATSVREAQPNGEILSIPHLVIKNKGNLLRDVSELKVARIFVNLFKGNDSFADVLDDTTRLIVDGAAGDDSIVCGAGNDSVNTGNGDDTLVGNDGEDTLDGGAGDDSVSGGNGIDSLISTEGADSLSGGDDLDTADFSLRTAGLNITLDDVANDLEAANQTGNVQSDIETIRGGSGADLIDASFLVGPSPDSQVQAEWIYGNGGKNTIIGGQGDDVLIGGVNNDNISGGPGADYIDGHRGRDSLSGDAGDDDFYTGDDIERDTLDGGDGDNLGYFDFLDRVKGVTAFSPTPAFVRP